MTRWIHTMTASGTRALFLSRREIDRRAELLRAEPPTAARVFAEWVREASEPSLRALLAEIEGVSASASTREDVISILAHALQWKLVVAFEPAANARPLVARERTQTVSNVRQEKHELHLEVVYSDGSPAAGHAYKLWDPQEAMTSAKLGGDAKIDKPDVAPGIYRLEIKQVDSVAWLDGRVRAGEPAELIARVSGFDEGASAKVRFFREHRELDADVICETTARVEGGMIRAQLDYDYSSSDARKAEQGVAHFIAEVSLEGGKYWRKSTCALELQLKTLVSSRWRQDRVGPSEDATVAVETRGYPDGTEVSIELWVSHAVHGPTKLAEASVTIEHDRARLAFPFTPSSSPYASSFESGSIRQAGAYFAVVVIDDGVRRESRTGSLRCLSAVVRAA